MKAINKTKEDIPSSMSKSKHCEDKECDRPKCACKGLYGTFTRPTACSLLSVIHISDGTTTSTLPFHSLGPWSGAYERTAGVSNFSIHLNFGVGLAVPELDDVIDYTIELRSDEFAAWKPVAGQELGTATGRFLDNGANPLIGTMVGTGDSVLLILRPTVAAISPYNLGQAEANGAGKIVSPPKDKKAPSLSRCVRCNLSSPGSVCTRCK